MSNKIKFVYLNDYSYNVHDRPQPSSKYLPDWFKNMPPYAPSKNNPKGNKIIVDNRESNATIKKCTPFLDGMTSGYTITLWSDVQVRREEEVPKITWRVHQDVFSLHGNYGAFKMPPPEGYDKLVFKYLTNFRIETPKGYSVMVRNPSGHNGLPFYAVPAIIDTDKSILDNNIPVWIKSDFEGIVEKGTPIAQIFPFKRDDWQSEFSKIDYEEYVQQEDKGFGSNLVNHYVKNIWSKKRFR